MVRDIARILISMFSPSIFYSAFLRLESSSIPFNGAHVTDVWRKRKATDWKVLRGVCKMTHQCYIMLYIMLLYYILLFHIELYSRFDDSWQVLAPDAPQAQQKELAGEYVFEQPFPFTHGSHEKYRKVLFCSGSTSFHVKFLESAFPWHYDIQYFTFMKHNLNANVMNVMKIHEAVVLLESESSHLTLWMVWRRQFLHPSAAARWRFWWMAAVQKNFLRRRSVWDLWCRTMGWDAEPDLIDLIDLIWFDRLRELHGLWLTMRHEKVNEL